MRSDHLDALLLKRRVERVGVVDPVAEQPLGLLPDEAGRESFANKGDLV
jgi:hypothetical protein